MPLSECSEYLPVCTCVVDQFTSTYNESKALYRDDYIFHYFVFLRENVVTYKKQKGNESICALSLELKT